MIPDIKYTINHTHAGFEYNPSTQTILVGMPKECFDKLTNEEIAKNISDGITHEVIHHILATVIEDNMVTTKLFEVVAHHFQDVELDRKVTEIESRVKGYAVEVWKDAIDRKGFEYTILNHYWLTKEDVKFAFTVANKRRSE